MHRIVCDIDSLWNQTDGESQYAAGAARGAGGDFVLEVVLPGGVRTVHRVGVAHNHPSDDLTPSKADLQLTSALQSTARLLGIKFLDHLILSSPDCEEGRGYVSVME